jgi:hypothetical protein
MFRLENLLSISAIAIRLFRSTYLVRALQAFKGIFEFGGQLVALDFSVRFALHTSNSCKAHRAKAPPRPYSVQNRSTNWLKYSRQAFSSLIFCKPHQLCRSARLA